MQSNFRSKYHRQQKRVKPQDVTSDMQVRCPHCGEFYQGNPEKCPHCKTVLKDE
ncbi:MAG: phage terminase large subunit family protein [Firmicutes bacterium]|nr:phage terminase large subunit family protein [Bacillota bacterium]